MGDAFSDIQRDINRNNALGDCLTKLLDYMKNPTSEKKTEVLNMTKSASNICGGYFSGETYLPQAIDENLEGLVAKNPQALESVLEQIDSSSEFYGLLKNTYK
jgi:hypothetical protein